MSEHFIVCYLLTPPGRGAVATVAVEGEGALTIIRPLFLSRHVESDFVPARVLLGRWQSEQGEEVVLGCLSPTRFEIHCHGGTAAAEGIIQSLSTAGACPFDWSLHTRYATEKSADEMFRAECLCRLPQAATEKTARILLDQINGASVKSELEQAIRCLDEGRMDAATELVQSLNDCSYVSLFLDSPFEVAIVGPPNVGKSSLLNAIVGYGRSIVFDQPGTTRDMVSAVTALDGWPFEFVDSAGLRETDDEIEAEGVMRTEWLIERASVVLAVFDGTAPREERLFEELSQQWRTLVVANKSDLPGFDASHYPNSIAVSCRTGDGIAKLLKAIVDCLPLDIAPGAGLPPSINSGPLSRAHLTLCDGDVAACRAELMRCLDPDAPDAARYPVLGDPNDLTDN